MSTDIEAGVKAIELYGTLERVLLDDLLLQIDRSKPAAEKGRANIETSHEVGVRDTRDGYFVSVTMSVQAIADDQQFVMYSIKAKMTGHYLLAAAPKDLDLNRLAEHALLRAALQIYPFVRRVIAETLARAGFNVTIPVEPDLAQLFGQRAQSVQAGEASPSDSLPAIT